MSTQNQALVTVVDDETSLRFNLTPDAGMTEQALTGFIQAANRWSSLLSDTATINLNIGFSNLGAGILGQATTERSNFTYTQVHDALLADKTSADDTTATGSLQSGIALSLLLNRTSNSPNGAGSSTRYLDNDGDANNTTIRVNRANAKALGLLIANDPGRDGQIVFNSALNWDFDPSDGISAGSYDFVGLVTHELGHTLGFDSGVDVLAANAFLSDEQYTYISPMDLFRFSSESVTQETGVIDWTVSNSDKYFSVNGGTTKIASFATGVNSSDNHQAGHWKDGLGLGIMDPTIAPGEQLSISSLDQRLFDVIGWDLKSGTEGTVGDDTLTGGGDNDTISSGEGNDTLNGGAGDDVINGGSGSDILTGGTGNDKFVFNEFSTTDGTDTINDFEVGTDQIVLTELLASLGYEGNNPMTDGYIQLSQSGTATQISIDPDGPDGPEPFKPLILVQNVSVENLADPGNLVFGSNGTETHQGDDELHGGSGNDFLSGGAGDDELLDYVGNDSLYGGLGNDILLDLEGDDQLFGGDGDDQLWAGTGADTLIGGLGSDTLFGDIGNDYLSSDEGDDELQGGDGNDTLHGGFGQDTLLGNLGDDLLYGGSGDDNLIGNEGADQLFGEDGDDQLWAGTGADTLSGGLGNDELFGEDDNDRLVGNEGNDGLFGGNGDDILQGGLGNDLLFGGLGRDTFVLAAGEGQDWIDDFQIGEDVIDLTGGLVYGALSISQLGPNTQISVNNETLAVLNNVQANDLIANASTTFFTI